MVGIPGDIQSAQQLERDVLIGDFIRSRPGTLVFQNQLVLVPQHFRSATAQK
jgi:hypothetical protein